MKVVAILALLFAAVAAQSCGSNPLLARAEVQARFGGSANVLATAQTTTNLGVCNALLAGQQVCVSDAGFAAFGSWLTNYKTQFVAQGQATRAAEMGVSGSAVASAASNPSACVQSATIFGGFLVYSALMSLQANASASAGASINYQALSVALQSGAATSSLASSNQASLTTAQTNLANWAADESIYLSSKAACAKYLMKHLIAVTCEAAAANFSGTVSGTASAPVLNVVSSYCATTRSGCLSYFDSATKQMKAAQLAALCTNSNVATVVSLLGNGTTFSSSVNSQLNSIWTNIQGSSSASSSLAASFGGSSTSASASVNADTTFAGLTCSNSATTASDCDFVCQNVLNATGFKANTFNSLNVNGKTRLLADQSMSYGSTGLNPATGSSDSDATVSQEQTPSSNSSSAFGLFVSFAGLIAGLLLL